MVNVIETENLTKSTEETGNCRCEYPHSFPHVLSEVERLCDRSQGCSVSNRGTGKYQHSSHSPLPHNLQKEGYTPVADLRLKTSFTACNNFVRKI